MKNILLILPAIAFSISSVCADETILLEENGLLVFEAETIAPTGDWLSTNSIGGHTGTGYYQWAGPDIRNPASAGADPLVYHIRITNPGNYELRWRSRIAVGNNNAEHNDSWVRFPTGSNVPGEQPINGWTKSYLNKINSWAWQTTTVDHNPQLIRQYFGAGDHTVEISGRSAGHAIDRIVLFLYDTHEFHEDTFNSAALSAVASGPVTLVEPSQPVAPPVVTPEPTAPTTVETQPAVEAPATPVSMAEQIGTQNLTDNNCRAGAITLTPVDDVYTQSGSVIDNNDLRVENGNRTAYLKFDASQVPNNFSSVSLQFNIGTDNGDGTLAIYAGDHSDWTDQTDNAALLPQASVQLANENGSWNTNSQYTIPLDSELVTNNQFSLLLNQLDGSSDFSLKSSNQSNAVPKLIFTGTSDNFCSNYVSNLAAASDSQSEPALQAANNETETQSGGGSISWSLIWLLLLPGFVARAMGDRPDCKN